MSKVRKKSRVSGDSIVRVVTRQFPRELGVLLADRQMSISSTPIRHFLERSGEAALLGVRLDDPVPFARLPPVVREPKEMEALLAAPDRTTWVGRRDHALMLLAIQTGLRLSELTSLDREAVTSSRGAHVRCIGKGRKERCTPLTRHTVATLRAWLHEPCPSDAPPLFPTIHGERLSSDAVQYLLRKHVATARLRCPSMKHKRVSPHVLHHTAAMELLNAGVDSSVIALWLGHESVETTQVYLEANLALKEAALAKVQPVKRNTLTRYRPPDQLLAFLNAL